MTTVTLIGDRLDEVLNEMGRRGVIESVGDDGWVLVDGEA